jgi:hypothetical protein
MFRRRPRRTLRGALSPFTAVVRSMSDNGLGLGHQGRDLDLDAANTAFEERPNSGRSTSVA